MLYNNSALHFRAVIPNLAASFTILRSLLLPLSGGGLPRSASCDQGMPPGGTDPFSALLDDHQPLLHPIDQSTLALQVETTQGHEQFSHLHIPHNN